MRAYLSVLAVAALGACATPPDVHPWGPGATVWWDRVRADRSTVDTRPTDRSPPFSTWSGRSL